MVGLLNFKKKSRKQQVGNPFEITHHIPDPSSENLFYALHTKNDFSLESSVPKEAETSLMDDIMNELGSGKPVNNSNNDLPIAAKQMKDTKPSPLLNSDSAPPSQQNQKHQQESQQQRQQNQQQQYQYQHEHEHHKQQHQHQHEHQQQSMSLQSNNAAAKSKNPAFISSQQYLPASTLNIPTIDSDRPSRTIIQQKQQKPTPLLSFSNSTLNATNAGNADNDVDKDDVKPVVANKPSTPPQIPQTTASPPAYNIATNNSSINTSGNLMDRMKERHRLEARRSLQPSLFMDNTQVRTHNLSSPSMPILSSAAAAANTSMTSVATDNKTLAQSRSFTLYATPTTSHPAASISKQRQQPQLGRLVKSPSDLSSIYTSNTSRLIQTQSDISLHRRSAQMPTLSSKQSRISHSPSTNNIRNTYLQTGPVLANALEGEQDTLQTQINNNANPVRSQLNRSVSAYPSFPQQSLQYQQNILQQQKQQQIQQQQIQQQIELQQHQLQGQQRLQQQKLQQLQIQQQQQQILNQTLLETTAAANTAAAVAAANAAAMQNQTLKTNHRRDKPRMVIVRSKSNLDTKNASSSKSKSKCTILPKPLYERSTSPPSSCAPITECHHGDDMQRQHEAKHHHCHHRSYSNGTINNDNTDNKYSDNSSNNKVELYSSSNVPDTPPPETHQDDNNSIPQKEAVEDSAEEPIKSDKATAIEEALTANSSTSTLTEGDAEKTISQPKAIMSALIRLPNKLKQELQSMQLRRSNYSVPDLTTLSTSHHQEIKEQKDWSTIEMFSNLNSDPETSKDGVAAADTDHNNNSLSSSCIPKQFALDQNARKCRDSLDLTNHCNHAHHHHPKRHSSRCSKKYDACCNNSRTSANHHCSSCIRRSHSSCIMGMPSSVQKVTCNNNCHQHHSSEKRHHYHHHHHHHHHGNKHRSCNHHRGYQCHHNNSNKYTLILQDGNEEEE